MPDLRAPWLEAVDKDAMSSLWSEGEMQQYSVSHAGHGCSLLPDLRYTK